MNDVSEIQEWVERVTRLHPTAELRVTRTAEIPEPARRLLKLLDPWDRVRDLAEELARREPSLQWILRHVQDSRNPDPGLATDIEGSFRKSPVTDQELEIMVQRLCAMLRNPDVNSLGEQGPRQKVEIQEQALGRYYSDGSIVIYHRVIERVATALGVDPAELELVVLAHEIAHAVTHLGIDADGELWHEFAKANKQLKEAQAQYWAWAALSDMAPSAVDVFELLESNQSETYRLWRAYKSHARKQVRTTLLACRRRGTDATWDYSRGILSSLSILG